MVAQRKLSMTEEYEQFDRMREEAAATLPSGVLDLFRILQEARGVHGTSGLDWPYDPAYARYHAAGTAIRDARPTGPAELAAQLRYLIEESELDEDYLPTLEHVAAQLEAMAGRAAA